MGQLFRFRLARLITCSTSGLHTLSKTVLVARRHDRSKQPSTSRVCEERNLFISILCGKSYSSHLLLAELVDLLVGDCHAHRGRHLLADNLAPVGERRSKYLENVNA